MKANRMLSIACAFAMCAAACSDSSQPAGPGSDGSALNRTPQPVVQPDDGGQMSEDGNPTFGRPIEDFILSQGTYCVADMNGGCRLYAPPVSNYVAWFDEGQQLALSVDFAGIANRWFEEMSGYQRTFGTHITGSVSEELRNDGRVLVTVDLHTTNAMAFAVRGPELGGPAVMGYHPVELKEEQNQPALGNAHLRLMFVNIGPGARLPDLNQLIMAPEPGQKLLDIQFRYDGQGSLREQGNMLAHTVVDYHGPFTPAFSGDVFAPMERATISMAPISVAVD